MSVRVRPTNRLDENRLVLEHGTHARSPLAERKFSRYWRVIKPMEAFVTWWLLRFADAPNARRHVAWFYRTIRQRR